MGALADQTAAEMRLQIMEAPRLSGVIPPPQASAVAPMQTPNLPGGIVPSDSSSNSAGAKETGQEIAAAAKGQGTASSDLGNAGGAAGNSAAASDYAAGMGAAGMSAGDADLKEPGGDAHWTLREEKDYILAKNQRTGEMRKLMTAPLSKAEQKAAEAKHGAGPLDANSPNRKATQASDLNLMSAGSGPSGVMQGGGMNVMGTLQQFGNDATNSGPGNPVSGGFADMDLGQTIVSQKELARMRSILDRLDSKFGKQGKK